MYGMKYSKVLIYMMVMLLMVLSACSNSSDGAEETSGGDVEGTVTVSAAASLTDALNDIAELFDAEYPKVEVDYNFGGSGALQQQITQGAPADIFFSANKDHFQAVIDEGLMDDDTHIDLLENNLVLIVPEERDTVSSFDGLENAEQIAVGTPESVPAGEYSVEAFESMGLYDILEERFVYAEDVRAVLNYVETGNVDAGTVYGTDAETSDSVDVVDTAPAETHEPILYPVGMLNDPENPPATEAFYDFLQSEEALEVFEDYGFVVQ